MFLSLFLTRWMTAMLYAVRPNDPVTFLAALVVLLFATLLGAFLPAYRASRINPTMDARRTHRFLSVDHDRSRAAACG